MGGLKLKAGSSYMVVILWKVTNNFSVDIPDIKLLILTCIPIKLQHIDQNMMDQSSA